MITVSNFLCFLSLEIGAYVIGVIDVLFGISLTLGTLDIINNSFGGTSVALLVELVANIFLLVAGILLIIGTFKGNKSFIKIWLILTVVLMIILLVNCILILLDTHSLVFTSGIIFALISIYFLIVVYSFYQGGGGGGD